jgi:phosphohistidine phosphatase
MHTLYLLRHAKSSWDDPSLPDHERPLAPRGRRDAKRIADHLAREAIEPDVVLCSSAARTVQTLELIRPTGAVQIESELYAASADRLLERVRVLPDEVGSAMLIGHNPGIQELALELASGDGELGRLRAKFPTAALASLTFAEASWSVLAPGDAVLAAFVVPKQLRR